MVNKNLFNVAVLGLGLTFGYSPAYAQEGQKSGGLVAENVDNSSAAENCPTCPPNVQVNAQNVAPVADAQKPKETQKPTVKEGKKGPCTEEFGGYGRCLSKVEAKQGGYTALVRGFCPGKDVCYDTTPKLVVEEKKVEPSQLEKTVVQQEQPAPEINLDFSRPFSEMYCDAENEKRADLLIKYNWSKADCETAKKNLSNYTANTVPALKEETAKPATESKTPAESQAALTDGPAPSLPTETAGENAAETKEVFNAETAKALDSEVDRLCGEAIINRVNLENYIGFVKEHGCNYKEPEAPKAEREMEVNVAGRGTYDGALGAELDVALLLPVGDKGHIGIYGNGTIPGTGVDTAKDNSEKDLGGFVQKESRTVDSARLAGLGAQAGYDFASWFRGYVRGGAALTEEKVERTIDILGDMKNISGENKPVRLEGALGIQLGGKHVYVPLEFRHNDITGPTGTAGLGGKF